MEGMFRRILGPGSSPARRPKRQDAILQYRERSDRMQHSSLKGTCSQIPQLECCTGSLRSRYCNNRRSHNRILYSDYLPGLVVQAYGDDLLEELVVRNYRVLSGVCEVFIVRNLRIWICLEQIELPFISQAIVQSSIPTQEKIAIDPFRKTLQCLVLFRRQFSRLGLKANS